MDSDWYLSVVLIVQYFKKAYLKLLSFLTAFQSNFSYYFSNRAPSLKRVTFLTHHVKFSLKPFRCLEANIAQSDRLAACLPAWERNRERRRAWRHVGHTA